MLLELSDYLPNLRVLLLSGYGDDGVLEGVQGMVAAAFLPKPFAVVELAQSIRRVLDEAH